MRDFESFRQYAYAVMFSICEKTGCGSEEAKNMLTNTVPNGSLSLAFLADVPAEDMADKYIEHSKSETKS